MRWMPERVMTHIPRPIGVCVFLIGAVILTVCVAAGCGGDPAVSFSEVELLPEVNAGWAGWCIGLVGRGAVCYGARRHPPVLAETWLGSGEPRETIGVGIATKDVARVEIRAAGISVPTRAEGGLPAGLRAVGIRIRGTDVL